MQGLGCASGLAQIEIQQYSSSSSIKYKNIYTELYTLHLLRVVLRAKDVTAGAIDMLPEINNT